MSESDVNDEPLDGGDDAAEQPVAQAPLPPSEREKEPDPEPPGAPEWVVTFTDMISLLVTFFVLLMTFSSMREYDLIKIRGILQMNRGAIEDHDGDRAVEHPEEDLIQKTDPLAGAQDPHSRPTDAFESDRSDERFRTKRDHEQLRDLNDIADGLLIQWGAEASFLAGSAAPNPVLRAALVDVAETVGPYGHGVVVEGHAAPDHVPTRAFPDAYSLSLARAAACAQVLIEEGGLDPARIQVAAYGDARAKALNDTPAGRNHNRRVELRVLSMPRDRAAFLGRGSEDPVR